MNFFARFVSIGLILSGLSFSSLVASQTASSVDSQLQNLSPAERQQLLQTVKNLSPSQKKALAKQIGLQDESATDSEEDEDREENEEQEAAEKKDTKDPSNTKQLLEEDEAEEIEEDREENALFSEKLEKDPTKLKQKLFQTPSVKAPENSGLAPQGNTLKGFKKDELKLFGYDLFAKKGPSTFAPVTQIPVPAEYVLGPRDVVKVQLFGKDNDVHELVVDREGNINFPGIGPITVAGLSFSELKVLLSDRISKQLIGVNASITMGELRSFRIFVMGEAKQPGSYTVSGLTTLTNALFVSGGVLPTGSLRNIQLKRNGKLIQTLDLYDLLLKGDTSADKRLLPGDVVFIPPVGKRAGISGQVLRPAVYELKGEQKVEDLIHLSGGFLPTAYPKSSRIERIDTRGDRSILDIDLGANGSLHSPLHDGDVVRIFPVLEKIENTVYLKGHVYRSGGFTWKEGLRISDLLKSIGELKPQADLNYAIIKRTTHATREVQILSVNLGRALQQPQSEENVILQPRDELIVFGPEEKERLKSLKEIMSALKTQSKKGEPQKVVQISGHVRFPGDYPLVDNMTVEQLLIAGGGLTEEAFTLSGEITRYVIIDEKQREVRHVAIHLNEEGDSGIDTRLQAHDVLHVQRLPNWSGVETVEIVGEVRFPGNYTISSDETLSQLIQRAGGITERAHVQAALFTRKDLQEIEKEQIKNMRERVQTLIDTDKQVRQKDANEVVFAQEKVDLLEKLEEVKPIGRLIINLKDVLEKPQAYNVKLRDGDILYVPRFRQEVSVIGEVQVVTSHLHEPILSTEDYIERSGGFTRKADTAHIYIVKANGSVIQPRSAVWFRGTKEIEPGDTIVVPLDVDRVKPLELWTKVTQILYQTAITVAAVTNLVK